MNVKERDDEIMEWMKLKWESAQKWRVSQNEE